MIAVCRGRTRGPVRRAGRSVSPVGSTDAALPAAPRPPRLPDRLASALVVDELDELYPDVDGVALDGDVLSLPDARTLDLLRSRLRSCTLELPDDAALEVRDAEVEGIDLTGRRLAGAVRTRFVRCRLSGTDLSDATIEDVTFEDCALDLASWRMAHVRRVTVAGGRIDGLDATGAQLTDVQLTDVSLADVVLDGVRCERVDLTGADLAAVQHVAALAGTTISAAQAVALAGRLARGLGIEVVALDAPV